MDSMKCKKFLPRAAVYALGLLFMAFGVAFSVNSNLGVSPVNSLSYVVSKITDIELGTCVIAVFSCYILLQILLLGKDFQWINLAQILFSTLFGKFVDFAKYVLGDFTIPTYTGKLLMLVISIVLVAIGISLYMGVKLIHMPMEGMTLAISTKVPRFQFHDIKVFVDCASVGIGIVLSWIFLGRLDGIREGTIICAIAIGKFLPVVRRFVQPVLEKAVNDQSTRVNI